MNPRLFLDSGAPTLYHKFARQKTDNATYMGAFLKDRKNDDYSWLDNEEYLAYRDEYVEYIKANEKHLEVYTNLDIVNNPTATWENQKYFESKGLNPLPVWHFGSDISFLKHYLKEGYTYIGIGGLVPNPYTVLRPALDEIFTKYLCDSKGMPTVKIHGFAATSIKMMCRYPWYSVDSASWIKYAAYGWILIPQKVKGAFKYSEQPHLVNFSSKSPRKSIKGKHYDNVSKVIKSQFDEYIGMYGFKMGKSRFEIDKKKNKEVEIVEEPGLINRAMDRALLSGMYYTGLTKELPEWPWAFRTQRLSLFD